MSYNPIQVLPSELGELRNLEHLHIFGVPFINLPTELQRLEKLKKVGENVAFSTEDCTRRIKERIKKLFNRCYRTAEWRK